MAKSVPLQEAAEEMSVSVDLVRSLIQRGELRAHRAGRAIRVYVDSLEDYQRRQEVTPQAPKSAPKHIRRAHKGHLHAMHTLHKMGID